MKRGMTNALAAFIAVVFGSVIVFSVAFLYMGFRAFIVYHCVRWLAPAVTTVSLPVPSFTEWLVIIFLMGAIRPFHSETKSAAEQRKAALSIIPTGLLALLLAYILKCFLL